MSFSYEIKKEILEHEYSQQQAIDFLSGLVAVSSNNNEFVVKINNEEISMLIKDMLSQLGVSFESIPMNKHWISLTNFEPNHNVRLPSYFFAGLFVGGGSMSGPESTSYHLEIQITSSDLAIKVKTYLNKYGFAFTLLKRRKVWVLYLKKSEMITDFLRVMQSFNSLMKFEDARISRDFHNQLNRYSNLDSYNQNKLAKASSEFIELYKIVTVNKMQNSFNDKELHFFELKKNNPYDSLSQLSEKYKKKTGIYKTRAGLNHYIYKLKKVVNKSNY